MSGQHVSGPLASVRVVEISGIGPAPFAAMLLADMGADVLRIDGPEPRDRQPPPALDLLNRGRRSAVVDLKHPEGAAVVLRLAERADALIEPFRPGVAERLGIGPDACFQRNPRLVYGRMTGWGQVGPYASMAGHDIDFIALSGVLDAIGRRDGPPTPPLNLIGDYGGGTLLAFGITCALLEARTSGVGQVIDATMLDAAAILATNFHALGAARAWRPERGANLLDSGAPFYDVYETADAKFVAVGAVEERFYAELVRILGLSGLPDRRDRANWEEIRRRFREAFASRTRAEWTALFDGTDACVAPVLSFAEAALHPHNVARGTFVAANVGTQPAPAPRLGRTPGAISRPPPLPGEHTVDALRDWGLDAAEVARLREAGAVVERAPDAAVPR